MATVAISNLCLINSPFSYSNAFGVQRHLQMSGIPHAEGLDQESVDVGLFFKG